MQAEALNHPVLMVQGNLDIDLRQLIAGQNLWEAGVVNYNPPGIPYEGDSDADMSDGYQAKLEGIVYVTGLVTIEDDSIIRGNLIAGGITVNSNDDLTIEYRPYSFNYPPPGFSTGSKMRIVPGTWKRFGY